MNKLALKVGAVALVQLALVGVAVAPRLSARLTGDEYRLRVAPVDPIDPFRGAYVDLDYPDLQTSTTRSPAMTAPSTSRSRRTATCGRPAATPASGRRRRRT